MVNVRKIENDFSLTVKKKDVNSMLDMALRFWNNLI